MVDQRTGPQGEGASYWKWGCGVDARRGRRGGGRWKPGVRFGAVLDS